MATVAPSIVESEEKDIKETLGDKAIKRLLAQGKQRGYITCDELNEALPEDKLTSEQIEDIMAMISEMGINIVEDEEAETGQDAVTPVAKADDDGDEDASEAASEVGRTDDPVRLYLREMGSVELLSREGEIEIAKRIEAGRAMLIGAICESPFTMRAIVAWWDALQQDQMLLHKIRRFLL